MHEGQTQPQAMLENTLLAFLCGAAVGVGVALLYAPKSGQETRTQLAETASQAMDTAGEWKDRAMDTAGEWKDRAMDTAGEWKEKAMHTAHETLDNVGDAIKIPRDGVHPNQRLGAKA